MQLFFLLLHYISEGQKFLLEGYQEFVKDGIMYRVIDMENVEVFADTDIYVGVNSETFYDEDAYIYDENTGDIKANEDYNGVNALFVLPVDESKADSAAAKKYLEEFERALNTPDAPQVMTEPDIDVEAFIEMITPENLDDYAKPVAGTKQIISNLFPEGKMVKGS